MNGKLFAGALALSLWGGTALANGKHTTTTPSEEQGATTPAEPGQEQPAAMEPAPPSAVVVPEENVIVEEERPLLGRVVVTVGAGVEGYTGGLNDELKTGFGWDVNLLVRPVRYLGFELAYTGATNEVQDAAFDVSGADMVRTGGSVLATLGLGTMPVEPYVLTGIGINWQNFRTIAFQDDTNGTVPLGGGLRAQIGSFTADARFDWNLMFGDQIGTPFDPNADVGGGRYTGTLRVGGSF